MSKQGVEFMKAWTAGHVHFGADANILAVHCMADATKAGIPTIEIEEEFGALASFFAKALEMKKTPVKMKTKPRKKDKP